MSNTAEASGSGIGFTGLLTIVFVIAKIWGKVTWPWIWVFSPIWISILLVLWILALVLIGWGLYEVVIEPLYERRRVKKRDKIRLQRAAERVAQNNAKAIPPPAPLQKPIDSRIPAHILERARIAKEKVDREQEKA